jgi:hypothetical protein
MARIAHVLTVGIFPVTTFQAGSQFRKLQMKHSLSNDLAATQSPLSDVKALRERARQERRR